MHRQSNAGCGISLYTPGVIPEELRDQFGNACELVCIQVPKVYDSCLLRLCLVGDCEQEDRDQGIVFDSDLRVPISCDANSIVNARVIGLVPGSFCIISKRPVPGDPDRKVISYTYKLKIKYDVLMEDGSVCRNESICLRRTETVGPLYCPESRAIIRETTVDEHGHPGIPEDVDDEILKLEIIARVLDAQIERVNCDTTCDPYDDVCYAVFTVGVYNIIKCELIVQLVVPAFGFCPPPAPCEVRGVDACEVFNAELPPEFFPPQLDDFISGPGI